MKRTRVRRAAAQKTLQKRRKYSNDRAKVRHAEPFVANKKGLRWRADKKGNPECVRRSSP